MGTHYILEMYDCSAASLNDAAFVEKAVTEAARQGLSTLIERVSHQFHPQGVTAIGLLAESHLAIHTWPEHGYAGADIFTCGETADPQAACRYLIEAFEAGRHELIRVVRGDGIPIEEQRQPIAITATTANGLFDG